MSIELSTDQKGAIAESAIAHAAIKLGVSVSKPLSDGERYDLIFDLHHSLVRVQCKWATLVGDVIAARCYSCRRTRDGQLTRGYSAEEIDAVAALLQRARSVLLLSRRLAQGTSDHSTSTRSDAATTSKRASTGPRTSPSRGYNPASRGRSSAGRAPAVALAEVRGSIPLGSTTSGRYEPRLWLGVAGSRRLLAVWGGVAAVRALPAVWAVGSRPADSFEESAR